MDDSAAPALAAPSMSEPASVPAPGPSVPESASASTAAASASTARDRALETSDAKRRRVDAGDDEDEDGGDGAAGSATPRDPNKPLKRNVALLLGYCGRNYFGMQVNPGMRTIESELFRALNLAGAVSDSNASDPRKYRYNRAARTDRGVHAVGQVASLKCLLVPNLVERINEHLPADIRIFDVKRVVGSFLAKEMCDSRIYEYFLPTYMFMPGNSRVEGATILAPVTAPVAPAATPRRTGGGDDDGGDAEEDPAVLAARALEAQRPASELRTERAQRQQFRLSAEQLAKIRSAFKLFEGTHNYHNYTSGKAYTDASAKRYVLWFRADEPEMFGDLEWLRLRVRGQSFILHQIRKMIGMVIAVMRTGADEKRAIPLSLGPERRSVPRAPGTGLFLRQINYDSYNRRLVSIKAGHDALDWDALQDKIDTFTRTMIYPVMAEEERNFAYLDFIRSVDFYKPDMQYIWGTQPALAGPAAPATAPIPAAAAPAPATNAPPADVNVAPASVQ